LMLLVRLPSLGLRFLTGNFVSLALAFGFDCLLLAFLGSCLFLSGPADGFLLLAFCLFCLQLQFQFPALGGCLGVCFTLGYRVSFCLRCGFCFAAGAFLGLPCDTFLPFFLLPGGCLGAQAGEF